MNASITCPVYTVAVVSRETGTRYTVTEVVQNLRLSERENELAQSVELTLLNVICDGAYLTGLIEVGDRVFVYADTGEENTEVFRGFVWEKNYTSSMKKDLELICYDNLIYMQKSEVCEFYREGTTTTDIINDLCYKWGIGLQYNYKSISHAKLPLKGSLADVMIKDVLDEVKKQTGTKYYVRSAQDEMCVAPVGDNDVIYHFRSGENAIEVSKRDSLSNIVTRVIITGKTDDDDRTPIEETIDGDVKKYGTIQKMVAKKEDDGIEEARQEANEMLEENGKPQKRVTIEAIDIPWVRKGDLVHVDAGNLVERDCIVLSVEHDAVDKKIFLECELINATADAPEADNTGAAAGKELHLNSVDLYISSDATRRSNVVTGTYYLYDGINILGRYRITNAPSRVGAKPVGANVTGWIDEKYI